MQLAVRLSVVPWAMLYMSSKLQRIVCIAFYFLFYECTHFFSVHAAAPAGTIVIT